VPADVVDVLEPVEVDDDERETLAGAPASPQGLLDPVVQQNSVGEPGERIVQSLCRR
jgi:hypothetical protein